MGRGDSLGVSIESKGFYALLANTALRGRMAASALRMQADPGTVRAADRIEQVARTGQPVLR